MINIIIGSFIGATISSVIMIGIKAFAIGRMIKNLKGLVAEISKMDCADED